MTLKIYAPKGLFPLTSWR